MLCTDKSYCCNKIRDTFGNKGEFNAVISILQIQGCQLSKIKLSTLMQNKYNQFENESKGHADLTVSSLEVGEFCHSFLKLRKLVTKSLLERVYIP